MTPFRPYRHRVDIMIERQALDTAGEVEVALRMTPRSGLPVR
jgi:hypothetical protein